jgi:hypothetical protein
VAALTVLAGAVLFGWQLGVRSATRAGAARSVRVRPGARLAASRLRPVPSREDVIGPAGAVAAAPSFERGDRSSTEV